MPICWECWGNGFSLKLVRLVCPLLSQCHCVSASRPSSPTLTSSLKGTCMTRAAWTGGTSLTTGCIAASTSSHHSATGEQLLSLGFHMFASDCVLWILKNGKCMWSVYLKHDTSKINVRLKPLDVAFMKAIHNKVNIVPVIAKADTLTLKERERLKKRVSDRLALPSGRMSCWACPWWLVLLEVLPIGLGPRACFAFCLPAFPILEPWHLTQLKSISLIVFWWQSWTLPSF